MGAFATVTLTGFQQLRDRLAKMDEGLKEQALRSAAFAGAEIVRDEAILKAPVMTGPSWKGHPPPGTLKKSIIVKRLEEEAAPYKQAYLVTVRRGKKGTAEDGYYARWVEYGHIYKPPGQALKGGKASKSAQRAAHISAGGVFIPAHPYMRPAYMSKKEAAKAKIVERLGQFLAFTWDGK